MHPGIINDNNVKYHYNKVCRLRRLHLKKKDGCYVLVNQQHHLSPLGGAPRQQF